MTKTSLQLPPVKHSAKFTADDYRATPEGPPWIQLIDGEFHVSESPSVSHQRIVGNLYLILGNWTQSAREGLVYLAPLDVYLSEYDVVQPDLLFVSTKRLSIIEKNGLYGPPDLAIEILSPSTERLDKRAKLELYARVGVREMWLVDPDLGTVEVRRFPEDRGSPVQVLRAGDKLLSPLLPGLEVDVSGIFRP